jgi:hypothetical protein
MCKQCLTEQRKWDVPNGQNWKGKAIEILETETPSRSLYKQLLEHYPDLSLRPLQSWLQKQLDTGILDRPRHGVYIFSGITEEKPNQLNGIQTVRITINPKFGS